MSLFLGNTSQYSQSSVDPEKIKLAEIQFNAAAATFNKLLARCAQKCVGHEYGESDLVKAEQCCIDRCVSKYVKANVVIGEHLRSKRIEPFERMPEYHKVQSILKEAALKHEK